MNELKIPWNILKTIKMYIEYGKIKPGISYKNVLRLRSPLCSTPLHYHPQYIHILSTIIYIKYPITSNTIVFKGSIRHSKKLSSGLYNHMRSIRNMSLFLYS
jgi:hypothetical protein